ncbi:MAG: hypothetical protein RIT14_1088 [Pseudomonadota bacterium]|jgi:HPt (histidine-containing phosphotransfer) domain-containing protein
MLVNWDRVRVLRDEIGSDDLPEVVAMFLEEGDAVLARLATPHPPARIEADLHTLKGTALTLGFDRLASLCRTGELAARAGQAVDLCALHAVWRDSRSAFELGPTSQRV